MDNSGALVSIIILTYNSHDTISRAMHSVFIQDYARIELIISDDGSSDHDEAYVQDILNSSERSFERTTILSNADNVGTVANLHRALAVSHGDCIVAIGGDDSFACNNAISLLINEFEMREWRPLLVTGVVELWSEDMNELLGESPTALEKPALISEDPEAIFQSLASSCIVPITATCFKREFIQTVGAFDTRYKYYEDYPTFLRMARLGIAPAFIDEHITNHASGGIANGTTSDELKIALFEDRCLMWEKEFDPYASSLPANAIKENKLRRKNEHESIASIASKNPKRHLSINSALKGYKSFLSSHIIKRISECVFLTSATILAFVLFNSLFGGSAPFSVLFLAIVTIELFHIAAFFAFGILRWRKKYMR